MNIEELDLLSEELTTEAKKDGIERFVSGVFILMNGDKTLLLKRADDDFMGGLVENPSGGVDDGETIYQAAIRETKEEAGITITSIDKYIGHFDYISASGKKCRQFNFLVSTNDTEKDIKLSFEHTAYYLVNINSDEYKELNISPKTKGIIEKGFDLFNI